MTDILADTLDCWYPRHPRRVTQYQEWSESPVKTRRLLEHAEGKDDNAPFVTVYGFDENKEAVVDGLFIDFDAPDVEGDWEQAMSGMLVRARMVARYILDTNPGPWRASLSGHKGIHLYLDFPAVTDDELTPRRLKKGLNQYADSVANTLISETGLESLRDYIDVTSADLARLSRCPNTLHHGASQRFGERRYCVPVSLEELADLDVDGYVELTRSRRHPEDVGYGDQQLSEKAHDIVRQAALRATESPVTRGNPTGRSAAVVARYESESNDNIEVSDLGFLLSDRPCVVDFPDEDMFEYGGQSHSFEIAAILAMAEAHVPMEVMKEYFSEAHNYEEGYTERQIRDVISRMDPDYLFGGPGSMFAEQSGGMVRFTCQSVWEKAPSFCKGRQCNIFRNAEDAPPEAEVGK